MKINFLMYFAITLFLSSCEGGQNEKDNLNVFLKENYEFNNRHYNTWKSSYYTHVSEEPSFRSSKLDELDSAYKNLISKIDIAIANSTTDLDPIILDYDDFSRKVDEYTSNDKKYSISHIITPEKVKIVSNEFSLNLFKNRLVMQMAYAYEFSIDITHQALPSSKVESNITEIGHDKIKLTLSSQLTNSVGTPRRIIINNFQLDGVNKAINYSFHKSYVFGDVIIDSLANGKYDLDGVIRHYEREGEYDVPFSESFIVNQ